MCGGVRAATARPLALQTGRSDVCWGQLDKPDFLKKVDFLILGNESGLWKGQEHQGACVLLFAGPGVGLYGEVTGHLCP